ncbi:AimR family lysis-lysogeny pheromone receptor [Bacillus pumilus]|uniref:AimR family lysis-lysogeny pheromone receptor n=1 Tax=Bacillus pumilus TaxID=1408 RepID=UPI002ABD4B55|nr:AimR family lysis-lysogeny pheromone receptor [Bacillus pumilus]
MSKLKAFIKSKCEDDSSLAAKLASIAGYSQTSGLYKFLNISGKETSDLQMIIDMIKEIDPDREIDLMCDYIFTLDPGKQCARQALEYLSVNAQSEKLDAYIEFVLSNTGNAKTIEWAKTYKLQRDAEKGLVNFENLIRLLGNLNLKTEEMKVYSMIIPMYPALWNNYFNRLESLSENVFIDNLEDSYVKQSFHSRLMLLLANCAFNQNQLDRVHYYTSYGILNSNVRRITAYSYLAQGNSLMLSDYSTSKRCFLSALEHSTENRERSIQALRSLCFLENLWGKENKWLNHDSNEITDRQEVAHAYIRKGEMELAKSILDRLEAEEHDDNQLGMHMYLKGLLHGSESYFYKSIRHFKLSGDKFSVNLPLLELEKLGADKLILEALAI